MAVVKALFVCMGNICRSPAAEGVFLHLVEKAGLSDKIVADSAGTIGYHAGELADPRMRKAASARGIDLKSRARKVKPSDFEEFDYVLAADRQNLSHLLDMANPTQREKIALMLDDAANAEAPDEVPDPYYGGAAGFELVLDLLEDCCAGLLDRIRRERGL